MGYEASRTHPNVVVDGSPNEATVLTLTHWPGAGQPPFVSADLSAEMVFRFLGLFRDQLTVDVVTNNHFDQDGLVSVHVLVDDVGSAEHRDLLLDVAAAGDFATYRDRRAARASMTISRMAERAMRDGYGPSISDGLYVESLPLLIPMVLEGDRFRDDWAEEDAELEASEQLIATGQVQIDERADVDLAVVTIPEAHRPAGGHRFAGKWANGLHPMAVNNATDHFRVLTVHGRHYELVDRYETWVQYKSRRPLPRRDLRIVADDLTSQESDGGRWEADAPSELIPTLVSPGESSLEADRVLRTIDHHLRVQPSAWDPYDLSGS